MLQSQLNAAKTDSEASPYLAGTCPNVQLLPPYSNQWLLDSGASIHICFDRMAFESLSPIRYSVTLPNSTHIEVHFAGTVRLFGTLLLQHVLFVPQFQYNLLSISALTSNDSVSVFFSIDGCHIQEKSTFRTIGKGRLRDGLYILDTFDPVLWIILPIHVALLLIFFQPLYGMPGLDTLLVLAFMHW